MLGANLRSLLHGDVSVMKVSYLKDVSCMFRYKELRNGLFDFPGGGGAVFSVHHLFFWGRVFNVKMSIYCVSLLVFNVESFSR